MKPVVDLRNISSKLLILAAMAITSRNTLMAANWKQNVLYSFQGKPDAATPAGGVVFDKQGNLYGAALGGSENQGAVFQLSPTQNGTWTETVLYSFHPGNGSNDGALPEGGLIVDPMGNLFGVTAYGGNGGCVLVGLKVGCGTVYEISPPTQKGGPWTEKILYSFQGGNDGYLPNGDLVFDKTGNLYGATTYGGGYGSCNSAYYQYCGTVFKLSPPKQKGEWTEKVLYSFTGSDDGANPNGGLVFDAAGAIYGTTAAGGNSSGYNCPNNISRGCGVAFRLKPPSKRNKDWEQTALYRFKGYDFGDGSLPSAGLFLDKHGHFYGTTAQGGTSGEGVVFDMVSQKAKWTEAVVHSFGGGADGRQPLGSLRPDASGALYGTTSADGTYLGGTAFSLELSNKGLRYKVIYEFGNETGAAYPVGSLAFHANHFYGVGQEGGNGPCQGGCGAAFELQQR